MGRIHDSLSQIQAPPLLLPGLCEDIHKAALSCEHCILGNNASHKAQHILGCGETDEPFIIVSFDICVPDMTYPLDKAYFKKKGGMKDPKFRQASLTGLCSMTGFEGVAFLSEMRGKGVANQVLAHFISPNGLPWMVLIDLDGLFKDELVEVFEQIKIPFMVLNPEQHEGILCERFFHQYLNKVQTIEGCNSVDHQEWMRNCLLAAYAWNAGRIDGTNTTRCFSAKAQTFLAFPLDVVDEPFQLVANLLSEWRSMSRLCFLCGINRRSL
jgi:hypothetical protein